jgi:hypothetical protein
VTIPRYHAFRIVGCDAGYTLLVILLTLRRDVDRNQPLAELALPYELLDHRIPRALVQASPGLVGVPDIDRLSPEATG